jgi:hypothetical protein
MSGSPGKIVPEVNLDEFEKRLRAAGAPSAGSEDPLAELTRLVNSVHADARRAARTPQSEAAQAEGEPAMTLPPAFGADLPSGFAETETETDDVAESSPRQGSGFSDHAPARRSRGWGFKVTGMIVVGVALLAGAAALKHGVPGLPKAPPFIAADDAPTKVQPPNEANVQSSGDVAALLMKDSATPTPVKVVNTEEQPVDLRTQTQPPTPSASAGPPGAVGPAPTLAVDPGSPVATAPETQIVPPAAASASVAPLFPGAKPVKTVSVRPDGTLIAAADASAAAAAPAPDIVPTPPAKVAVRAVNPVVATPEAATPKLDLPTKLSPKSQQRVVAKTDTTAPNADASATPSAPLQLVASPKPSKPPKLAPKTVAEASVADSPPADAAPPGGAAAPNAGAPPSSVQAAIAPLAAAPVAAAEGGGDWAVQLAAPRSEADAKGAIAKLKSKYSAALGDSTLSIHQADVKGETIYRVRVSGLSRADASSLCSKLKAGGGDCFIAKD